MPIVRVDVKKAWPREKQLQIIDALHSAMIEALKIPGKDKNILYTEHQPEHFATPPTASENYTLIEFSMFPGRSLDAKRKLYQGVVKRLGDIGIEPKDVFIVIQEPPRENWGIRGGIPASEVDLGFKIDV
jgi:phenylpyruvate tautomerase PptA (4-oxalocrotonate tautomerase family)